MKKMQKAHRTFFAKQVERKKEKKKEREKERKRKRKKERKKERKRKRKKEREKEKKNEKKRKREKERKKERKKEREEATRRTAVVALTHPVRLRLPTQSQSTFFAHLMEKKECEKLIFCFFGFPNQLNPGTKLVK